MTDQEKHSAAFGYRAKQRDDGWYRQLYRLADPPGTFCIEQPADSEADAALPNRLHEWFVAPECKCSRCRNYFRFVRVQPAEVPKCDT